jgi:hypothetical protein
MDRLKKALAGASIAAMLAATPLHAAQFNLPSPAGIGHTESYGAAPVGTGCTIVAGSTDTDGECTTSAASGSIAFATAYASAPSCIVVDKTSAATVPQVTYTTTTAQITLTTVTSGHGLVWHCSGKVGG